MNLTVLLPARRRPWAHVLRMLAFLLLPLAALAQPTVTGLSPTRNQRTAPRAGNVALTFSQAISAGTAGNIRIHSQQRGGQLVRAGQGVVSGGGTSTVTFDPATDFRPGETVTVTVPPTVQNTGGQGANKQVYQFTAAVGGTGTGNFLPPATNPDPAVTDAPSTVAVGDVDGDGDLDFVTASNSVASASVRMNDGSGSFTPPATNPDPGVGSGPGVVVLGDVDGDGDLDLLTANGSGGNVSVRLNNGSGSFGGGADVPVGTFPLGLALGDVDGDGDLDFVAANAGATTVSVRLNNGSGTFGGGANVVVGTQPLGVTLGDVDGDGDLDMLAATAFNTVGLCRNDGSGAFGAATTIMVGSQPYGLTLGDVDGDGDLDLLTANNGSNTASVRLNDGSGSFSGSQNVAVGVGPRTVVLGDVDGDGDLDLLTANYGDGFASTGDTSVRLNDGTGTFGGGTNPAVGSGVTGAVLGDVDGDGDLDLLAANFISTSVSIRLNQPPLTIMALAPTRNRRNAPASSDVAVTFSAPMQNTAATQGAVRVFSQQRGGRMSGTQGGTASVGGSTITFNPTTDFRPGETVLVTTTTAATGTNGAPLARGHVHQFTAATGGTGAGNFGAAASVPGGNATSHLATGDLNADGRPDLLWTNYGTTTVGVALATGPATYAPATSVTVAGNPVTAALADFDGDGDLDFVTANYGNPAGTGSNLSVGLNAGAGTFAVSTVTTTSGPRWVTPADVDADGDLDLLVPVATGVQVYANNGSGAFALLSTVGGINFAIATVGADVDGDGDFDLLTSNYFQSNTVSVRLNDGTGTFSGAQNVAVGTQPFHLAVGDVDGDGDLDFVTANQGAGTVSVRLNAGGTFAPPAIAANGEVATGAGSSTVALGDVDGDGDLDLLASVSGGIALRLNDGNGVFSPPATGGTLAGAGGFPALADLDNDGDLDLTTATGGTTVSVRLNQPPAPNLTSLTPNSGPVGTSITLAGTNFTGATGVSFNGTAATTFSVTNATTATATVPVGATSGNVTITTSGGTSNGVAFTVVPLTITALAPTRNLRNALPGSDVAVTFSQAMQNTVATQEAVRVFSQQRGGRMFGSTRGVASVSGSTITFNPTNSFKAGETVLVTTTTAATATGGGALASGHVHQFTAAAGGTGSGNFQPGTSTTVGGSPRTPAVADIDGDGDLDLLSPNFNDGTVSVRVNNGSGTLSGSGTVAVGPNPLSVVAADIDGDGDLDLLAPSYNGTVSIRINNGAGAFSGSGSITIIAANSRVADVAVGDVDGDGDLDLFTANLDANSASVRLNNGSGTFSGTTNVSVGTGPVAIAVADVDADGDLDLLTANSGGSNVSVRLNNGSGAFSGTTNVAVGANPGPGCLALADVDGDGDLDLLVANNGTGANSVSVRLNDGSGAFGGGADVSVGGRPNGLAVGDVDADGDMDFLASIVGGNVVALRLNDGSGTYGAAANADAGTNFQAVALGDVDGDGDLDLLSPVFTGNGMRVRFNQPPAPVLASLSPGSEMVGASITLTGTGFTGATGVSFNGTAATVFSVTNATTATATVPAGATTGDVTITTPSGTSNGVAFTVVPSLSSLTLSAGSLSQAFASGTTSYTLTVPGTTTSTTVTPTNAQTSGGPITVNGTTVASGAASGAIALNPGANTITVVVDPPNAGPATTYTVTVTRTPCAVTALAQNVSVALDANGNATVAATAVDNGSSSTCGAATLSVSPSSFTCANLGANVVTLTVTDGFGGSATAPATVTVTDGTAPIAVAQAVAVSVAADGRVYVAPTAVNNGSSDNCAVTNVALSASAFGACGASSALVFDGSNDYVTAPHNAAYTGLTALTLEAWIRTTSTGEQYITTKNDDTWYLAVNGGGAGTGKVTFYLNGLSNISGGWLAGATTVSDGSWHHVAATYDGAALRIYVDGVLDATRAVVGTIASGSNTVVIGARPGGSWNGSLDELRIWNTARTAAQLNLYKDKAVASTSTGLLAYYDFNDGAGSATITNRGPVGGVGTLTNFGSAVATAFVGPGQVPALGTGAQTVTLTVSDNAGNVSSTTATVTVSVPTPTLATWTGAASTDWTSCANWQYGTLPTAAVSAVLPAGMPRYPSLPAGTYPVLDLTLAGGSSLSTTSGTTLQLSGSFANNGGTAALAGPIEFVGTAAQTVGGSAATAFATVVVNKASGSLTLGRDLTISTTLTLTSGTLLTTAAHQVTLGAAATLAETTGAYVTGTVEATRLLSTAGAAETFGGLGLALTPNGATLPGSTTVRRLTGTPLTGVLGRQGIARSYDVTAAVNTGLDVALTFAYFDHELNGIAEGNLALFKSVSGAGGPWANQASITRDAVANTVSKVGVAGFSVWTLGDALAPLPVELSAFTATAEGNRAVRLAWATASETNSDRFEVERSLNGTGFERIATVAAAGSSSTARRYALLDTNPPLHQHTIYYRLRQVDMDGTFSYSPVRAVALSSKGADGLTLAPNPGRATTLSGATAGAVVTVYDALGRRVLTATADAVGTVRLVLPAELPTGVYLVRTGNRALRLAVE